MSRVVWKFDPSEIAALHDPLIVHFGMDPVGMLSVWIEHNSGERVAPLSVIEFEVVGTGIPVPDDYYHVQSAVVGAFVWHLYAKWGTDAPR